MNEDCGPCTQLNVTMALRDGVDGKQLAAVLAGDEATMSSDVALAVRFARAALAHDLEADGYREEIVRRWGAKGPRPREGVRARRRRRHPRDRGMTGA